VALQPDGRVVAVGSVGSFPLQDRNGSLLVTRYLPNGSPDLGFGAGGRAETFFGMFPVTVSPRATVVVQPDGTLAVAGSAPAADGGDFALAEYLSDGRLDDRFGDGGTVTTDFAGGPDTASGLLRQDNGRLVAVGTATAGGLHQLALAGYQTDTGTAIPSNDDAQFVRALYRDLLGRDPDAGGLAANTQALDAVRAQAFDRVVRGFVASPENRSNLIAGYYTTFLGRPVDAGGLQSWLATLQGSSPEWVLAGIVASDEYFQRAGGTNAAWLDRVYRDVLGRDRDPGSQGFLDALTSGQATRLQVAAVITGSEEYRTLFVTQAYERFLGRRPGAAEIRPWLQLLAQPPVPPLARSEEVVAGILASAEYVGKNGNSGQGWLDSLYRRLLNRLPDAPGYNAALVFILSETGGQRLATAAGLTFSPEYLGRTVADAYTRFLGRAASPEEVAPRVEALRRGLTQEQLLAGIAASDEAFRRQGSSNAIWLDALYIALLGRSAGDPGSQSFLDCLNTNRCTRTDVAVVVLGSDEYRRRLVQGYFTTYLGRRPGDGELAAWVAVLQRGDRQEQVLADFVASAEYFQQAGAHR
jgi:PAS domain-containing protein